MRKDFLALTGAAFLLLNSATAASAQQGGVVISPPELRPAQQSPMHDMGAGTTGQEDTRHSMMAHRGAMAGPMMRMMFSLMDADSDGTISLQEFQAAHERIFKAIDVNKDGRVTLDEMQAFMHGTGTSIPSR